MQNFEVWDGMEGLLQAARLPNRVLIIPMH